MGWGAIAAEIVTSAATFALAALAEAGTTVIHVETERGGVVYTDCVANINGALFWSGSEWGVNDTYGHMYFVNLATGLRLKTFNVTQVFGAQPLGQVLARDGYTVTRGRHVYTKRATSGGACFVDAVTYRIVRPGGKEILLLSRGTGHGTEGAAFDVLLEDPDDATTTTAFWGDPLWLDVEGDVDSARTAVPHRATRRGDLPSVDERYFLDIDGGSEMGGTSFVARTHGFGPAGSGVAGTGSSFISEFSVQYSDGSNDLQEIKLFPGVIAETPARYDLVVPAAANTAGDSGTRWQTDLDLFNANRDAAARVELALLRANRANPSPVTSQVDVPAGQTLRLANLLGSTFSAGNAAVGIRFVNGVVSAASRFYNTASACGGTFGMLVPGERPAEALDEADTGTFQLLSYSSAAKQGFRVNIGFASHCGHDVDVEIDLLGDDGSVLKTVPLTLLPFEHRQLTRIHSAPAPATPSVGHGFAAVRVLTPASLVHAYAMLIDNVSGDPIYLAPVRARR